ncbi:MAG TPA: MBL fold metallo-hydrolase [Candidatus Paceibacterota bacterium]
MSSKNPKLTFCGGTGSVTGANFLLESPAGDALLVDCGMAQGGREAALSNHEPFSYDPSHPKVLIVTHAHIDHIGRIPQLVARGFNGQIVSTRATMELARPMLTDAAKVSAIDAQRYGGEPLYGQRDVEAALAIWRGLPYHEEREVLPGVSLYLRNAGHILGSATVRLSFARQGKEPVNIAFTGDLGNAPTPLLPDPEPIPDADYLLSESVYGDRRHEGREERRSTLAEAIKRTIERGGTALVPIFSLEKTQAILYELNELIEGGELPRVPVFLDSPLAIAVTEIYSRHIADMKDSVRQDARGGDKIFDFPGLTLVNEHRDSGTLVSQQGAKIILAGSGMSEGGRIRAHEKACLADKKNAVIIVGYQVLGSLGRKLKDGDRSVTIDGEHIPVRAEISWVSGYSSHADTDALVSFAEAALPRLKKVFCAMGEPKAAMHLAQRLGDELGVEAVAPERGDKVTLE